MFQLTLSIKRRRKWIKHFHRNNIRLFYKETELGGKRALSAFIEREALFRMVPRQSLVSRRTTVRFVAKNVAEGYFKARWR